MTLRKMQGRAYGIHSRAFIHYSAELSQHRYGQISIGEGSVIGKDTWLNVICEDNSVQFPLQIGGRSSIGRNNVISVKNKIVIAKGVVTGPQVLIMDHNHEFRNVHIPILDQGVTIGGEIELEEGCWIGFGAVILCSRGSLRIGRNSIVGANSVVTKDVEPMTVVVGSPARAVSRYESSVGGWIQINERN